MLQNRCQRKVNGTVLGENHRKSCSWDLREHHQRSAQQAILGENSDQRRLYLNEYIMKIQNLERRNSEYALFESQRELGSQRLHFLEDIQRSDQAQRESMFASSIMLYKKLPRNWIIENTLQWGRKSLKKQRRFEKFPTQQDQESRTVSLFFCDPDLLRSYDIPVFFIKLLLPRVQESLAAKLECREIQERIWVFLETFLIDNMLDEILMNYTIIQETWQHHRESLIMSRDSEKRRSWE